MLGTQASTNSPAQSASPVMQVPTQAITGVKGALSAQEDANGKTTWAFLGAFVLYLIWAIVERHERVQESVKPSNIVINLRSLGVIALSVIVSMNLLKVLFTKMVAWKIPFARTLLQLVTF